jgi:hypothetical protein
VTTRPDIVAALIGGIGDGLAGQEFEAMLSQASAEEVHEAVQRLTAAAQSGAKVVPQVLELSLWAVARLVVQGRALEYASEQLPTWRSWPDQTLSDQLKIAAPHVVADVRHTLRRAGLDVDEGETGALDDEQPGT